MFHVKAVVILILAEIAGAAVLGLVAWLVLAVRRRRMDRSAARTLVEAVRVADEERRAALREALADSGLAGEALDEQVSTLVRGERRIYKAVVDTYLERDAAALGRFQETICEGLEPYRAVLAASAVVTAEEDGPVNAEVGAARAETEKLREELQLTKQTMSNMLNEYAQIYARGDGAVEGCTASRILRDESVEDDEAGDAPEVGETAEAPLERDETTDTPEIDETAEALLGFDETTDTPEVDETAGAPMERDETTDTPEVDETAAALLGFDETTDTPEIDETAEALLGFDETTDTPEVDETAEAPMERDETTDTPEVDETAAALLGFDETTDTPEIDETAEALLGFDETTDTPEIDETAEALLGFDETTDTPEVDEPAAALEIGVDEAAEGGHGEETSADELLTFEGPLDETELAEADNLDLGGAEDADPTDVRAA